MALSPQQARRYSRHLTLTEIGAEGQERLLAASVILAGRGSVSAAALDYLVAAGVGTIRLASDGEAPDSLLPLPQASRSWVEAARALGARLNPEVRVDPVIPPLASVGPGLVPRRTVVSSTAGDEPNPNHAAQFSTAPVSAIAGLQCGEWRVYAAIQREVVTLAAGSCARCIAACLPGRMATEEGAATSLFAGAALAAEAVKRVLGLPCIDQTVLVADLAAMSFESRALPACAHAIGNRS